MPDSPKPRGFILPPPIVGALTAGAMWLVARLVPFGGFDFPGQTILGALLAACGLLIDVSSLVRFRRDQTTINPITPDSATTLVVDGLYVYSRNPMYLGMLLILTGWALYLGNILNVALLVLFV